MTEKQVAVFIDFENIAISAEDAYGTCDLGKIMQEAEKFGRCVVKRAYGDWTRFSRYRQELIEHAIDLTQLFRSGGYSKKNAADIVMVVDTLETALTRPAIETFVLATGDSDFSAVARKLRGYGRHVIGIGLRDATSEVLVRSCDQFILYDDLIDSDTESITYDLEYGRQLLLSAMRCLHGRLDSETIPVHTIRLEMLRLDPEFDELTLGYHQFHTFLDDQKDLVHAAGNQSNYVLACDPSLAAKLDIDRALLYRTALNSAGFRLVDATIRKEVLRDFQQLLVKEPGTYRLDDAILQLKACYDDTNVLRSRDEIQEIAKLAKLANVMQPHPQSWELDPLTIDAELTLQDFSDRCESVYVGVILQKNLDIQLGPLSLLLYGTADQQDQVEHLCRLAQDRLPTSFGLPDGPAEPALPHIPVNSQEFNFMLQDLLNWQLDNEPSLESAVKLNNQGLRIRTADFERARIYFLKAAKMMYELLKNRAPGASLMDLEWYLASYCAATAGACFSRRDFPQAYTYYLAFFALVRETEPVWDKVRRLVPPMLSFYFTIASNEHNDILKVAPGRTHPARLAILLFNHDNLRIRERWLEMVRKLANVNTPLVRGLIQRLQFLDEEEGISGARQTRITLATLIEEMGSSQTEAEETHAGSYDLGDDGHEDPEIRRAFLTHGQAAAANGV